MRRMSTPTHKIIFPFEISTATALEIAYSQNGEIKLTKKLSQMTVAGKTATVILSQSETKNFTALVPLDIQAKVLIDDKVIVTDIARVAVKAVLSETILTEEVEEDDGN